jgi:KipI family sensor histidine kinase inhibitor
VSDVAPRIREAGDSALLLELEPVIDAEVNARAIRIAASVRDARIAGVRDVFPTYRSVAVLFDPLTADPSLIVHALRTAQQGLSPVPEARTIEIPVSYGGDDGPDLESVAARAGVSKQEVIDRHAAVTYRVFMLGFLPGFAYLGGVDPSIAAPRHATPRPRVPAGSVGIAGRQTGVYPRESPGGWQLIGRTPLAMFDPLRSPASLVSPGDQVRFLPVSTRGAGFLGASRAGARTASPEPFASGRSVTVVTAGLFTTVQDLGRWGYHALGVPVSGPMDIASHRLANLLVGNPWNAATIEATVLGPELRFDTDATIALTGADLSATLNGAPMPLNRAVRCTAGCVLRFGERRRGARAYIAVDGGVGTVPVLGSRATHVLSALGGVDGRTLKAGDALPLLAVGGGALRRHPRLPPVTMGGARLRVLPGPQDDFFHAAAMDTLQRTRFTITSQSDRMGYRLAGRARIERTVEREMVSDATFIGGIQVPPSGDPILLMADRQTTGGYPQIATVITADVPLAGQLAPGDWVEFQLCTRAEALDALVAQEAQLLAVE